MSWVSTSTGFNDTPFLDDCGLSLRLIYEHGAAFMIRFLSSTVPKSDGCMVRRRTATEWGSTPCEERVERFGNRLELKAGCMYSDF